MRNAVRKWMVAFWGQTQKSGRKQSSPDASHRVVMKSHLEVTFLHGTARIPADARKESYRNEKLDVSDWTVQDASSDDDSEESDESDDT